MSDVKLMDEEELQAWKKRVVEMDYKDVSTYTVQRIIATLESRIQPRHEFYFEGKNPDGSEFTISLNLNVEGDMSKVSKDYVHNICVNLLLMINSALWSKTDAYKNSEHGRS